MGVAGMVHRVGVVVLIRTVTPNRDSGKEGEKKKEKILCKNNTFLQLVSFLLDQSYTNIMFLKRIR